MSAFSDCGCITELEVSPSHTCGIVSITSECARVRPALGREGLLPARVRKPLSFVSQATPFSICAPSGSSTPLQNLRICAPSNSQNPDVNSYVPLNLSRSVKPLFVPLVKRLLAILIGEVKRLVSVCLLCLYAHAVVEC